MKGDIKTNEQANREADTWLGWRISWRILLSILDIDSLNVLMMKDMGVIYSWNRFKLKVTVLTLPIISKTTCALTKAPR